MRVAGEDPRTGCCQGFRASSASQRRTVEAEGAGAMPLVRVAGSSGQVQRAGASRSRRHLARQGLDPGQRRRGERAGPAEERGVGQALDALLAVAARTAGHDRAMPSRSAIAQFATPSAARSPMRARTTSRNGAVARRDEDSSSARPASPRRMT